MMLMYICTHVYFYMHIIYINIHIYTLKRAGLSFWYVKQGCFIMHLYIKFCWKFNGLRCTHTHTHTHVRKHAHMYVCVYFNPLKFQVDFLYVCAFSFSLFFWLTHQQYFQCKLLIVFKVFNMYHPMQVFCVQFSVKIIPHVCMWQVSSLVEDEL